MINITIYIDVIFLENLVMNYIIIYATSIILKIKLKILRGIVASGIGSIYAILLYVTNSSFYNSIITKIVLSIFIVYIAFNAQNIKILFKEIAIFYLTSFLFGGVALYLIYVIKPQEILTQNGFYVGNYVLKVIILGAILGTLLIKICLKIIKSKMTSKDMICKIKIKLENKWIETKAMIDTGNLAKEPITNIPVIIVESSILEKNISQEILKNIDKILIGDFSKISKETQEKYKTKLRCIPFSSLGKQHGMLLGIKVEEIIIEKEYEDKKIKDIIVAIYDKSLTKRGEYRSLIGLELINM